MSLAKMQPAETGLRDERDLHHFPLSVDYDNKEFTILGMRLCCLHKQEWLLKVN